MGWESPLPGSTAHVLSFTLYCTLPWFIWLLHLSKQVAAAQMKICVAYRIKLLVSSSSQQIFIEHFLFSELHMRQQEIDDNNYKDIQSPALMD